MKRAKKVCIIVFLAAALISVLLYVPIWIDDAEARRNREQVYSLISVGQDFDEAQQILLDSGFELFYEEPIKPTINEDYYQQLVIVGETQPNMFESFGYAADILWMPFTHTESPYVVINASLEGTITEID